MEHFVAYHSVKQMGRALASDGELNFFSRKLGILRKAVGNTVWIVQGSPVGSRTMYSLHGAYVADQLQEVTGEPGLYRIGGANGIEFDPPVPLTALEWFPALLKTQSNFSLGFNRISDAQVVQALVALRAAHTEAAPIERLPDAAFEKEVASSCQLSPEVRRARLENAPRKPAVRRVEIELFDRNPDVVAEALFRAAGRCECCKNMAPFLRRSDGTPYLEVHHKVQLAHGGDDTVENAEALCPNCHRRAHHGQPAA